MFYAIKAYAKGNAKCHRHGTFCAFRIRIGGFHEQKGSIISDYPGSLWHLWRHQLQTKIDLIWPLCISKYKASNPFSLLVVGTGGRESKQSNINISHSAVLQEMLWQLQRWEGRVFWLGKERLLQDREVRWLHEPEVPGLLPAVPEQTVLVVKY